MAAVVVAMGVAGVRLMLRPAIVLVAMMVAGMRLMLPPAVVLGAIRVRGVVAPAVRRVVAVAVVV